LVGGGGFQGVRDGKPVPIKNGTTYLADVKHVEDIVVTGIGTGYSRTIQFGNTIGTSPFTGSGVITITTDKNYGTGAAAAPVSGQLFVNGQALTATQMVYATGALAADTLTGGL